MNQIKSDAGNLGSITPESALQVYKAIDESFITQWIVGFYVKSYQYFAFFKNEGLLTGTHESANWESLVKHTNWELVQKRKEQWLIELLLQTLREHNLLTVENWLAPIRQKII